MISAMQVRGARCALGLVLVAVCGAAVTLLPAGIGALGRKGGTASGSQVDIDLQPPCDPPDTFTHVITPGEAFSTIRNLIVTAMENHPEFSANSADDPGDPNANGFHVNKQGGADVDHLKICENDANIDDIGVSFSGGKDLAVLNKVAQVNANGNYRLVVDPVVGATFDQTFNTTAFPNNTAAGLNTSIITSLTGAGFLVADDGVNFVIRKSGGLSGVRVFSSDTGVVILCLDVTTNQLYGSAGVPTISQVAMFLLVVMMTATAIWILRRQSVRTT